MTAKLSSMIRSFDPILSADENSVRLLVQSWLRVKVFMPCRQRRYSNTIFVALLKFLLDMSSHAPYATIMENPMLGM